MIRPGSFLRWFVAGHRKANIGTVSVLSQQNICSYRSMLMQTLAPGRF